MKINDIMLVRGCITQEHYIKGRSLGELERILGFEKGRLENGIIVAALIQLPTAHQFEFLGYSQVAEHKHKEIDPKKLDIGKLKQIVLNDTFTLSGHKRLVKVIANKPHDKSRDNDEQYPPGLGVPQWKLTANISARIIGFGLPGKNYI